MASRWRITERDLDVLEFVTRYGAAVAEQVREEFFRGADGTIGSVKAVYRRLKALQDRGAISGERIFYRMPMIYRPTEQGAALAQVDLPSPRHDLSRLHHTLELVQLSRTLRTKHHGSEWRTEREVRRDKLAERRDKETGRMRPGGKMGRTPDGVLILESGEYLAVELELTPKRAPVYHRIFSDYESHLEEGEYDGILFWFASRKTMARVRDLSRRHELLDGRLEFTVYEPVFERRR